MDIKEQKEKIDKIFEKTQEIENKRFSEAQIKMTLSDKQKIKIIATQNCLLQKLEGDILINKLNQDNDINNQKSPLTSEKAIEQAKEFNRLRLKDINITKSVGNYFSSLENLDKDKRQLAKLINETSPNVRQFGKNAVDEKRKEIYVRDVVNYGLDLSINHHRTVERWKEINHPPRDNTERNPINAYKIVANKIRKTGEKSPVLDEKTGRELVKSGYSQQQIEQAISKCSPFAIKNPNAYSNQVIKTISKDKDISATLSKNVEKTKSR